MVTVKRKVSATKAVAKAKQTNAVGKASAAVKTRKAALEKSAAKAEAKDGIQGIRNELAEMLDQYNDAQWQANQLLNRFFSMQERIELLNQKIVEAEQAAENKAVDATDREVAVEQRDLAELRSELDSTLADFDDAEQQAKNLEIRMRRTQMSMMDLNERVEKLEAAQKAKLRVGAAGAKTAVKTAVTKKETAVKKAAKSVKKKAVPKKTV